MRFRFVDVLRRLQTPLINHQLAIYMAPGIEDEFEVIVCWSAWPYTGQAENFRCLGFKETGKRNRE